MKVRSKSEAIKATRVFTDREEPRAAFWKNYDRCTEEMATGGNIHVLTYYGIGGIGKSSLLKKLMSEMDERFTDKRHIYFDFTVHQESRAVLTALKNKLTEQCKYTFPLFELGSYMYAKKIGDNPDSLEIQQLTEKSPFLSLAMSIAGNIPMLGFATSMLSLADQCVAYVRTYLKNHSRELKQIEYMEAEELYRHLPYLFAEDLAHNQEQSGKLLVIMLDTYERLVNELSATGDPLMNDLWIRGEEGLIQNIPNVLWVIAGREKLKWERFDPDWADALEQHILGNLSLADSDSFLSSAGVGGSQLRQQLYELTNGTPVYLDLCVDQFTRLSAKGILPDISMFGQNTYELIERFIRYMSDSQKDLVYTMACLQMWNDDLIMQIAGAVLPNFSLSTYEKAKDFSFVIQSDDNWYNIHQTVGEVLLDHCPQTIRIPTGNALIRRFSDAVREQPVLSPEYADELQYMTLGALLVYTGREELRTFFIEHLCYPLRELLVAGRLEQAKPILNTLTDRAGEVPGDRFFGEMLYMQSFFSCAAGDYHTGKQQAESTFQLFSELLGEDHPDTIRAMQSLAISLNLTGEAQKALEIKQTVLDKHQRLLGEEHPKTISTMVDLTLALKDLGELQKALELGQTVLYKSSRVLGEEHSTTIRAMDNLANIWWALGEYKKTLELQQAVLEKRRRILGEDHPTTISAMEGLSLTLVMLKEYQKAKELKQTTLDKCRRILGEDHPTTISAMLGLAFAWAGLGELQKAKELEQAALDKYQRILGEDHSTTTHAMSLLAVTLKDLGELQKTLELQRTALDKRRRILGEEHPKTIHAMRDLADTLDAMSRTEEARALWSQIHALEQKHSRNPL